MDSQLQVLSELQQYDSRIASLEAEAARLPRQIEGIQAALADAKKSVDILRARQDQTRKDLRVQEKDLEVVAAKRAKSESRLYEVKTNKEYSAVLLEIEEIKQDKAQIEEQILALMEMQERVVIDVRDAEHRHARREEQARQEIAEVEKKLAAVEAELAVARANREARARDLPRPLLGDYDRIRKARGGVAVATVGGAGVCSGCRVTIRPQAMQELRAASTVMLCESCGRFLFWQD